MEAAQTQELRVRESSVDKHRQVSQFYLFLQKREGKFCLVVVVQLVMREQQLSLRAG